LAATASVHGEIAIFLTHSRRHERTFSPTSAMHEDTAEPPSRRP
jgi:hypothetical protein